MMRPRWWFILATLALGVQLATAAPWIAITTNSLLLPPAVRLRLGGEKDLQKDCQTASKGDGFIWAHDATKGYEVATKLFQTIALERHSTTTIWFPAFTDTEVLQGLARVLNDNTDRLGGVTAQANAWPKTPCHVLQLSWASSSPSNNYLMEEPSSNDESNNEVAVTATKTWVDNTLCRLSLCPYTASLSRAAVGLESANVQVGPIIVRPTITAYQGGSAAAAVALATTFWEGVTEIATTPEQEVATSLLIAPSVYDANFVEFAATCDELIEASVQVVQADQIVGRAWFHPNYNASMIGHDKIVAGHALPASMVQGFIDTTTLGVSAVERPNLERVTIANDAVRWTPHATINLLRRSQLTAAKQVEAASANKKPNAIYARNVLKIITDQQLISK